jgi:hypothetical protein
LRIRQESQVKSSLISLLKEPLKYQRFLFIIYYVEKIYYDEDEELLLCIKTELTGKDHGGKA